MAENISSHSPFLLHLHHTPQQSTCDFPPDGHFSASKSYCHLSMDATGPAPFSFYAAWQHYDW